MIKSQVHGVQHAGLKPTYFWPLWFGLAMVAGPIPVLDSSANGL